MDRALPPIDSPAAKIIDHLQRQGEASVKDLEDVLRVSTTAVREHLTHLQTRGLLATKLVRRGPGRPHVMYSLTPQAHTLFPKSYDALTTMLLRELASRQGPEALQGLLDAVGARMADSYRGHIDGEKLPERLEALRIVLETRGIPAELQPEGDGFHMFACPYLDVAQEHAGVCAMERRMIEELLGDHIHLEVEPSIRKGGRSCHFRVTGPEESGTETKIGSS